MTKKVLQGEPDAGNSYAWFEVGNSVSTKLRPKLHKIMIIFVSAMLAGHNAVAELYGGWQYRREGNGAVIFGQLTNAEEVRTFKWAKEEWRKAFQNEPCGILEIPNEIADIPLTCIGHYAFINCTELIGLKIPDSVKGICSDAFEGCSSLRYDTTTIPGVKLLDGWVVGLVDSLPISGNLILKSVRGIANGAFENCTNITSVTIPDSVRSIGAYAFRNCSCLTSVRGGKGIRNIGVGAFRGCEKLAQNGFVIVGGALCEYVGSQQDVSIPDGVICIGESPFGKITSVSMPDSVVKISENAFEFNNLTNVVMSKSVSTIGRGAFHYCDSLTCITIPDSVTSMGDSVFKGCSRLKTITLSRKLKRVDNNAFQGCKSLREVVIPQSVDSIGDEAFRDCLRLRKVVIQNDDVDIGRYVFRNCPNLRQIDTPDGQFNPNTYNTPY